MEAETVVVTMLNVAVVAPAATVTLAGTCAAALLLERVTEDPPVGAAALNVTVPVALLPPVTVAGLTVTDVSVGNDAGFTVKAAVWVVPYVAEIVT